MSKLNGIHRILTARERLIAAEQALYAACQQDLPLGTDVSYEHGGTEVHATVIEYDPTFGWKIKVRGRTGRDYWLDVDRILDARRPTQDALGGAETPPAD